MSGTVNGDVVPTITVSNTTPDLYAHEMEVRLAEWHEQPLEPVFTGRQWIPLLLVTLILPTLALVWGWFV